MCIILKEAIKKGLKVCFFTMSEIVSWYMSNWFDAKELKKDVSIFKECDILGIDDCFDRTKTYVSANNMQIAQIDDLFRYRVHNWKSFLVTANISKDNTVDTSILNTNLLGLLNRKTVELTLYGDVSGLLQTKLKKEIIGNGPAN
jgi:DNA replication protein DnaC